MLRIVKGHQKTYVITSEFIDFMKQRSTEDAPYMGDFFWNAMGRKIPTDFEAIWVEVKSGNSFILGLPDRRGNVRPWQVRLKIVDDTNPKAIVVKAIYHLNTFTKLTWTLVFIAFSLPALINGIGAFIVTMGFLLVFFAICGLFFNWQLRDFSTLMENTIGMFPPAND